MAENEEIRGLNWPEEVRVVSREEVDGAVETPRRVMTVQGGDVETSGPELVTVKTYVEQEFVYPGTDRPAARVLAHAGEVMTKQEAEQRGLDPSAYDSYQTEEPRSTGPDLLGDTNTAPQRYDASRGGAGEGADLHQGGGYDEGTASTAELAYGGVEGAPAFSAPLEQSPEAREQTDQPEARESQAADESKKTDEESKPKARRRSGG